jgi:hypothetical protein
MPVRPWAAAAASMLALLAPAAAPAQERPTVEAVSFDRDAKPIFRKRCGNCHNPERPRGELDLTTYAGVLAGGASGKAAVAGRPEESPLYTFAAHLEEPNMPPNAAKIPQREIDVLRLWIEGGLRETAAEARTAAAGSPGSASAETVATGGLVAAPPAPRATPITALDVSPDGGLAAVSAHKRLLLFDLAGRKLLGAVPFPEGDVFALRFSRDGASLLAAGGVGAESGKVALYETKTWARTATLGDELDAILAADLSPDGGKVALGGPGRVVKVLASPDGRTIHTLRKPTDWVTAAAFSPDGLLVAAGDRFGGLFLWEARSGQEFLTLRGHTKAVNAVAWDVGGDRLVTAGDDGSIRVWDLHAGKDAARWEAHAGGVLGIHAHPSGRIASAGRDRRVKVWDLGGKLLAELGPAADQATRVAWAPDGRSVLSGDAAGDVRLWSLADSSSVRLPLPVAATAPTLALVTPVLAPARRHASQPIATPTMVKASAAAGTVAQADDLEAALASAREAAAAAERAVDRLSRVAQSRGRSLGRPAPAPASPKPDVGNALAFAKCALSSLRAALAADADNVALRRAVDETEEAIRLLVSRRDRGPAPVAR